MQDFFAGDGFVIISTLGAVQGIFLAALLAGRRRNREANRLLALVMLLFAVDLGMAIYHARGYEETLPHLVGLDIPLAFAYGPLFYLYSRTLTVGSESLRRRDLLHFLPLALVVFYLVPFYAQDDTAKILLVHSPSGSSWLPHLAAINYIKLVHAFVYLILVILVLRRHRRRVRETFSSDDHVHLAWLRNVTMGAFLMWGLGAGLYLLPPDAGSRVVGLDASAPYDEITLLAVTVFVYTLGYLGLRQPQIFDGMREGPEGVVDEAGAERPRYARSGLDADEAAAQVERLQELMEREKPYRRGDLALQDLADALSIPPHNLTEILNAHLGQSFYDFVNGYRVREVQERLESADADRLTLLAIGMEAGFNSKSSFNAVFKRHTQMTPSAYREHASASRQGA